MNPLVDTVSRFPDRAALITDADGPALDRPARAADQRRAAPDAGDAAPDAGDATPNAGDAAPDAGDAAPDVLTWSELASRARTLARALQDRGIRPGDVVATLLGGTREHVLLLHAVWLCGAAVAPLNLRLAPSELRRQIGLLRPALLIADDVAAIVAGEAGGASEDPAAPAAPDDFVVGIPGREGGIPMVLPARLRSDAERVDASSFIPHEADGQERCSVLFTSGTSGAAKAITHRWDNHRAAAAASAANLGAHAHDTWQCVIPLYHIGGLAILLRSMFSGMAVRLHERFDSAKVLRAIRDEGVTLTSLVPTMLHRLLDADPEFRAARFPELRAILLGGAAASASLWDEALRRGLPVLGTYGMTETCAQVATGSPAAVAEDARTAGRPLRGVRLEIRDEDGHVLPAGMDGEIWVAGPMVVSGEDGGRRPETRHRRERGVPAEAANTDIGNDEGDLRGNEGGSEWIGSNRPRGMSGETTDWLRTGDVGHVDRDGRLVVAARREDLILSGGENILPGEIEEVLLRHPAVAEAAVVGIPDEEWGQRVAAALVLREEIPVSELETFCRSELAGYKIPRHWLVLDALPRTASGKLRRGDIRTRMGEGR